MPVQFNVMSRTTRIVVGGLIALMVAWLVGWIMGRSGKPEIEAALGKAELRLAVEEARSRLLEARVDLFTLNFGNASRRFEEAKLSLRSAAERLADEGPDSASAQIAVALRQADEGQAFANKLDQTANARAAEALSAIDRALERVKE
jgi:hypothetical protein